MGLLSSLQNLAQKYVSPTTSAKIADIANKALTIITSPVSSLINFEKAQTSTAQKGAVKLVAEGIENTLVAVAPITSAGKSILAKTATTAFSTIPKAVTTTASIGVVAGLVATPAGRQVIDILPTPSDIFSATKTSTEKVVDFVSGGEEVTGKDIFNVAKGAGVGAVLAGGAVLAYEALKDDGKELITTLPTTTAELPSITQEKSLSSAVPLTPATATVEEVSPISSTKRKKRTSKTVKPQNISQRVNITFDNDKMDNKKYIKGRN